MTALFKYKKQIIITISILFVLFVIFFTLVKLNAKLDYAISLINANNNKIIALKTDLFKLKNKRINTKKEFCIIEADNNWSSAKEFFKAKKWDKAITHYNEAIFWAKKSGFPDNANELATYRYNIAMAYWNEKNEKKAKEKLLEIQKKHPRFLPDKIEAQIITLIKLGY